MKGIVRKLLVALVIFFPLSNYSFGETLAEFSKEMAYFYLDASEERFSEIQNSASTLEVDLRKSRNRTHSLVSVFIATVAEKHSWPIVSGAFESSSKKILERKTDYAKYVTNDSLVDGHKLDIWWSKFSATGDEVYVEKIFKYAAMELPQRKDQVNMLLVIGVAKWSFSANCRQHKKVKEFAIQKYKVSVEGSPEYNFLKGCAG